MSFGRKDAEEAEYRRFLYPGTEIFRNKLDIRDAAQLDRAARMFVDNRLHEGMPAETRPLTYAGFLAIHRHLFQDVYDWAGQERTYTTGRGPSPFAPPEQITPWMQKQFAALKVEKNLVGLKPREFADRAAHYVNEVNAVHPFIDGNGRTQRVWLRGLAHHAGYTLTLSPGDREAWNEASKVGFYRSNEPMAALIFESIQPKDPSRSASTQDLGAARNHLSRPLHGRGRNRDDTDQGL